MKDPEDPTFGVRGFSIAGRMVHERERIKGMNDTERQWRAQWLKDQVLSHDEPRNVPEFYKETTNIFRRLYKEPLSLLQKTLEPILGQQYAYYARHTFSKSLIFLYASWIGYYIYKYNSNDWTRIKSIEMYVNGPIMYPDHPDYPNYARVENYYDQGFSSSPFAKQK